MLEYQLTFAGIPFVSDSGRVIRMEHTPPMGGDPENQYPKKHQPCTDLVEELNRLIPFKYLQDFGMPNTYAGRNLWAIAREWQVGPLPSPEVKIGDWYYPTTASRWSVFRGLATSSMTKAMLAATGGTTAKTFIMKANPVAPYHTDSDQTSYTLNTQMFMLPPRPLAEHGAGFDGLYLITLVDERYWWQYNPVSIQPSPSLTWVSLIQQLATVLMVTVTITNPSDNYGSGPEADSPFWCNFENAATLLDAAGYNVGTTCVRDLDGSYSMQTAPEAQALVVANRGMAFRVARTAGGDIFNSGTGLLVGDLNKSKNSVLPSQVSVTFPKYVVGNAPVPHFLNSRTKNPKPSHWYEDSYGDVYPVTVGIGSGGAFVSGLAGVSTTVHTLHNTAKALYSGEGDANPFNTSGLTALAVQQATDFYNDQVASALDEVYPGTFAWTPEGFHDIIWTYSDRARGAFTRVMKGEWNRIVREYQHPTPVVEGMRGVPGVGGPLVAQSWKDSTTAGGSTTLGGAIGLSDSSVVLSIPLNSLPPQNRWQGTIDSEIILFEGCSGTVGGGTVTVGVVQRGFEGTSPASHNNGTAVSQLFPNMTYGVNCVTFEKGQYTYPSDCTSGGITGVNVVPQTQTVQVTGGTGPTYTGRVYASTEADGTLVALENCLVQERNSQTPTTNSYYDGQFVGNVDGSPLYLINVSTATLSSGVINNSFFFTSGVINNQWVLTSGVLQNFNFNNLNWNFWFNNSVNFNGSINILKVDITNVLSGQVYNASGYSKLAFTFTSGGTASGFPDYIGGFTAGSSGQILYLWNSTANNPVFIEHLGMGTVDDVYWPLQIGYSLWPGDGCILEYDGDNHYWRPDHPTLGAGDSTLKTYPPRDMRFVSGLTYTEAGNGKVLVGVSPGGGAVVTDYGQFALGSVKTINEGAWTDSTVNIVLPSSGLYWLEADFSTSAIGSGACHVMARLYDVTTATAIGDSVRIGAAAPNAGLLYYDSSHIGDGFSAAGADTIRLEGYLHRDGGVMNISGVFLFSDTPPGANTTIGYIRLK